MKRIQALFLSIAIAFQLLAPIASFAQAADQQSLSQIASLISSLQSILNSLKAKVANLKGSSSIQTAQAQAADITSGLVGHWKFDEASGTTATDSSGNNNTGTLTNGPTWTTGKIGGALSFDGVDDYVRISEFPESEGNAITVSAWVKPNSIATRQRIVSKDRSGFLQWSLYYDGTSGNNTKNEVVFKVQNTSGIIGTAASDSQVAADLGWHHVVGVYDGANVYVYFDGTSVDSTPPPLMGSIRNDYAHPICIGTSGNNCQESERLNGLIDEVRIYNRALTASEVQTVYAYTGGPPPAPDTASPSTPTNLTATSFTSTQINLTWSASTDNVGVSGYRIYRNGAQVGTPASPSYSDTGLSPSTTYSYTVAAVDAAGNISAQSSSASATTQSAPAPDTQAPAAPTNLSATAVSSSQINLSWSASTDNVGVTGYRIYRGGSQIATTVGTAYQNTGLTASTNYSYTVAAYDAAGNVSLQSPSANATTQAATTGCSGANFSFGIFSDTYSGQEGGLRRVFNEMLAKDPNIRFLTTGGDTSDATGNQVYQRVRGIIDAELSDSLNCGATAFPWLPTPGNHDSEESTWDWWSANWANNWATDPAASRLATQLPGLTNFRRGPLQVRTPTATANIRDGVMYSFDYKNAHFISIDNYEQGIIGDSSAGVWDANGAGVFDPSNSQLDWIKQDLQQNTKPITFVFSHVALLAPIYSSSNPPPGWSEHNSNFRTAELTQLLADYNVTAFFHGHDHVVSRRLINGNRTSAFDRLYWDVANDPNKPYGTPSQWTSLQGPGRVWQIDAGRVYTNGGTYVITKVADTGVTFEIYSYPNNIAGSTELWDTWTVPIGTDTTAPTTPSNLSATAVSSSQINLSWTASMDNVGVAGYRVYRAGAQIATVTSGTAYSDAGLMPSTSYSYTVAAYDAAGNISGQSTSVSVATQADTLPPSTKFQVGDRVEVSSGPLNVRNCGSVSCSLLGTQTMASQGVIIAGPTNADGYWWWNIDYDAAPDGWSVENYLQKYSAPPPTNSGITLYVDPQIPVASCSTYVPSTRSCAGGSTLAYRDLNVASGAVNPGDTVLVRGGIYGRFIPQRSGSASGYIIFKPYNGETVTITDSGVVAGLDINAKQYIIVDGFMVDNIFMWGQILNSSNIIIKNNRFTRATDRGSRGGVRFINSDYNKVLNNYFNDGNDNLFFENSNRNLAEGNTFARARHTLLVIACSNYNIIRNNTFHNELAKGGETFDCEGVVSSQYDDTRQIRRLDATKRNIWEKNIFQFTAPDNGNGPFNGIQYAGQNGIIRKNIFYGSNGIGLGMAMYADEALNNRGNRIYNNVFHDNLGGGIETSNSTNAAQFSDNIFKNNIIYANRAGIIKWADNRVAGSQTLHRSAANFRFENNNILSQAPGELTTYIGGVERTLSSIQSAYPLLFMGNKEQVPNFVNAAGRDYHLASGSPMVDGAAFLTVTFSAGSGTILPVGDASYFTDGFDIVGEQRDFVQLSGQTQIARILSVDYAANTLALDRSLSWAQGQGVSLAYNGPAPDLGAYEFDSSSLPSTLIGDLNNDRIVNSLDWSIMNSTWGTNNTTADLNRDGMVNSLDFSLLNANWGRTI